MKNAIARFQSSIVLMAALALAACAGDDISSPGSSLTPEFNSTPTIGVLLAKRGPLGSTATFSISATGGNLPAGSAVTLNACP
ncbi:MAG TPA: hypothetical protein VFO52_10580, partial [Longimicrobiales bacterium]|nr:hypothetical protein [Longimicrobiales bacterium]